MSAPKPNPFWGNTIAELRRQADMSQREVAVQAGVTRSVVSRIECSSASIDIDVVNAILNVFGYELDIVTYESRSAHLQKGLERSTPMAVQAANCILNLRSC